ncbi:hypothetical protein SD78_1516 [Bacillus badius]|nr:hypothetical protein SD78_1516 [Bacillus badius]
MFLRNIGFSLLFFIIPTPVIHHYPQPSKHFCFMKKKMFASMSVQGKG